MIEPERVNELLLDLPCGAIYETSTDVRRGLRWYDVSSLLIRKRLVFFDLAGTWSLSPTGAGPSVRIVGRAVLRNTVFPDPEDPDTWPIHLLGPGLVVRAQGFGQIIRVTGPEGYDPDDYQHGVAGAIQAPNVAEALCDALGS